MIPEKLILSGFLSYQDPVVLNFDGLELACISGANGAGKSSLLDAVTWSLFGEARCRDDDALINSHVNAAEVIFEFHYEGNLYRVQRSKPRGKTTVLEFYVLSPEGDWRTLTEKSVRETENRLRSTLRMNFDTFINASFFLQGKADHFAQQQPSNRKKVLTNVLGLEIWETYRAGAVEKRRGVESELRSTDLQLEDIEKELGEEAERKTRLAEIEQRLEQLSVLRQAKENELNSVQKLAAALAEQRRLLDVLRGQLRETMQRIERLQAQQNKLLEEQARLKERLAHAAEAEQAYRQWLADRASLEQMDRVAMNFQEINARRGTPLGEILAAESVLRQEQSRLESEAMTAATKERQLALNESTLPEVTASIQALQQRIEQRGALEKELQDLQQRAAGMKVENDQLRLEMQELRERIDTLKDVEGAICPLCGQPLNPQDREALLNSLEAQGKQKGDTYRMNQALQKQGEDRKAELAREINGMLRLDEELRASQRKHDQAEAEIHRLGDDLTEWRKNGALRLGELEKTLTAKDFAHASRRQLEKIDAQAQALGYDVAVHDALRAAEQAGRASEQSMRDLDAARATLEPLERQIAGVNEQRTMEETQSAQQDAQFRAAEAQVEATASTLPDVNAIEDELRAMKAEENRLRMDVGMVRQLVSVLDSLRERKTKLTARRTALAVQINRLKALERAFGKDGVPALLIEQALPEIEEQANGILDRLSAGGMSVRFKTQRELKSKKEELRETLDIAITDHTGKVREYELFSGGEAFRVNFAIRLALSRVLAHRAGARLQTLFIDEGFGSQDAEGRQRLLEAISLVRNEFARIIVITHLEDLKDAFPSRIEVEKTARGSTLRVLT